MSRAHQFSRAAELGANPRRRDLRDRFAPAHERPGESLETRTCFRADGLAGQHGLIEQDISLGQLYVRSDNAAK